MKKKLLTGGLWLIIVIILGSYLAYAQEDSTEGVDIMVVIDKSDSVNWNDPHGEILNAMERLLNLSIGTGNRIGFVVYNDTIIAQEHVRLINDESDVETVMNQLQNIHASRGTDIGLALQTARRQLELDDYRFGETALIFLSDGWYEFSLFNLNRDQSDVMEDVHYVLNHVSFPIFAIEYRMPSHQNSASDNAWKDEIEGRFFASNNQRLMEIVDEVYELIITMAYEHRRTTDEVQAVVIPQVRYRHPLMLEIIEPDEGGTITRIEFTITYFDVEALEANDAYINISEVGSGFTVTIENPEEVVYTIYYETYSSDPLHPEISITRLEVREPLVIPFDLIGFVLTGTVAMIIIGMLGFKLIKSRKIKKTLPKLTGQLECYFMEVPTGFGDIPIQSWSASYLSSQNKMPLSKLLRKISLASKMPETEKIYVKMNLNNTISIINKAGIICFKDGCEVKEKEIIMRHNEGLYMVFLKKTIEIELRARLK